MTTSGTLVDLFGEALHALPLLLSCNDPEKPLQICFVFEIDLDLAFPLDALNANIGLQNIAK